MEVDEKMEDNHRQMLDFSSIRGKKALISPTHEQFDLLKKLLENRIIDSGGETIFEIGAGDNEENGLEPDEYDASVCKMFLPDSLFGRIFSTEYLKNWTTFLLHSSSSENLFFFNFSVSKQNV